MPKREYIIYRYSYSLRDYEITTAPCNKRFSLETTQGNVFAVFSEKHLYVDHTGNLRHLKNERQENTYALVFGDKLIFSAYCDAAKFKHAMAVGFERDPDFVDKYVKQVMDLYTTTTNNPTI
jgi:hypothetical protein